ncbi:MAG: hypothetical protein U5L09_11575 [Bacteroidales bacterium]|nr:hypothetical protein [Bacteroidales bacterium]
MRSMVEELSTSVCFLLIEEGGAEYWQLPGKIDIAERAPTSELPAHLAALIVFSKAHGKTVKSTAPYTYD